MVERTFAATARKNTTRVIKSKNNSGEKKKMYTFWYIKELSIASISLRGHNWVHFALTLLKQTIEKSI